MFYKYNNLRATLGADIVILLIYERDILLFPNAEAMLEHCFLLQCKNEEANFY